MGAKHVLGKFRPPMIAIISAIGGYCAWKTQFNIAQALLGLVGGAIAGWVATTEVLLKVFLSAIPAGISGSIAFGISQAADLAEYSGLAGLAVGLLGGGFAYNMLDKSSWIGTPCEHCYVRGKTDQEQINKQFLGQKTEKQNNTIHGTAAKWVTYNLYHVTYRNWCKACGVEWQTTAETSERA